MNPEHFREFNYENVDALNYRMMRNMSGSLSSQFSKILKKISEARQELYEYSTLPGAPANFIGEVESWTIAWKESSSNIQDPVMSDDCIYAVIVDALIEAKNAVLNFVAKHGNCEEEYEDGSDSENEEDECETQSSNAEELANLRKQESRYFMRTA
jgi:hypothetical protein